MNDDIIDLAKAHIDKVLKDYVWPEASKFFHVGLHVSPQNSPRVLEIEDALYQKVQARYPGLYLKRAIHVSHPRTYDIEIHCDRTKERR